MSPSRRHPSNNRLFAIGDIHGCVDELAAMLKAIAPVAGDTVIFVGDYIDRGPASLEVVDLLLGLRGGPASAVFLKGNHEDMMLDFIGLPGRYGESFVYNGGAQTLESYGAPTLDPEALRERLPASHLNFFKDLAHSHAEPPYFFVHAGIQPDRPIDQQETEALLWIRHEFIFNPHDLGMTVVFGHTPMRTVMVDRPFKIGIDTGLVYGGKLTCLELREGLIYQVSRGSKQVKKRSLDAA